MGNSELGIQLLHSDSSYFNESSANSLFFFFLGSDLSKSRLTWVESGAEVNDRIMILEGKKKSEVITKFSSK